MQRLVGPNCNAWINSLVERTMVYHSDKPYTSCFFLGGIPKLECRFQRSKIRCWEGFSFRECESTPAPPPTDVTTPASVRAWHNQRCDIERDQSDVWSLPTVVDTVGCRYNVKCRNDGTTAEVGQEAIYDCQMNHPRVFSGFCCLAAHDLWRPSIFRSLTTHWKFPQHTTLYSFSYEKNMCLE